MLDDLEWPSLETRREQSSLTFFYKIHSGTVDLDKDKYLTPAPNLRRTRASHESQYTRYFAYSVALKNSFFPRTIPMWNSLPSSVVSSKTIEEFKVQNCAARFVTRNYDNETGSMTGILGQLKWESLKKRRKDNRLILLYKGLKGKAKIPTDDLIPKTRRGRNQHSLAFQIPSASKDVYMYSFFPQTIRDWNDLPESLISSSELSDDSVSKFTSLVRARD